MNLDHALDPATLELTFEQRYELQKIKMIAPTATKDELVDLLVSSTALMMVRQNIINGMIKGGVA